MFKGSRSPATEVAKEDRGGPNPEKTPSKSSMFRAVVPTEALDDEAGNRRGNWTPEEKVSGKEKNGLGFGSEGGVSSSSRKPPWQMGQARSDDGDGDRSTVRSHW